MAATGTGLTAVVTGGNRGIGLEICRQLAVRGVTVLMGSRDPARGEAARASLGAAGAGIRVLGLALDDPASIAAAAAAISADPGRLDILINNAGVFDKADAPAQKLAPAVLERTLRTNLVGPLLLSQALLPLLRRSGSGRIINISSGMGQLHGMGSGSAAYRLSKTALNGLTATLAADLLGDRIAVNAVCPGWVKTDMGGAGAQREVAQGADTPVWLALDAEQVRSGGFWRDRAELPW
jgi:NAD(P)-dependent dehydrogenase (short-subunit alcohol dehydrogenase family)